MTNVATYGNTILGPLSCVSNYQDQLISFFISLIFKNLLKQDSRALCNGWTLCMQCSHKMTFGCGRGEWRGSEHFSIGIKVALTTLQVLFGCHGNSYYSEAGSTLSLHLPGNDRPAQKTLNSSKENVKDGKIKRTWIHQEAYVVANKTMGYKVN